MYVCVCVFMIMLIIHTCKQSTQAYRSLSCCPSRPTDRSELLPRPRLQRSSETLLLKAEDDIIIMHLYTHMTIYGVCIYTYAHANLYMHRFVNVDLHSDHKLHVYVYK